MPETPEERCQTCGSGDRKVKIPLSLMGGEMYCRDPWHDAPLQPAPSFNVKIDPTMPPDEIEMRGATSVRLKVQPAPKRRRHVCDGEIGCTSEVVQPAPAEKFEKVLRRAIATHDRTVRLAKTLMEGYAPYLTASQDFDEKVNELRAAHAAEVEEARCRCNCHDAPNEMFPKKHTSCEECRIGLEEEQDAIESAIFEKACAEGKREMARQAIVQARKLDLRYLCEWLESQASEGKP